MKTFTKDKFFLIYLIKDGIKFLFLFLFPSVGFAEYTSINSTFNNTPVAEGNYIWFRAVFKLNGVSTYPVTVSFANQSITSSSFNLIPPNSTITFYNSSSCSTSFSGSLISSQQQGLGGNYFLAGCAYLVPAGGLPGGLNPVTWSGELSSSEAGVTVQWKWSAEVYSSFSPDYNSIGIKPCDDAGCSVYTNNDHSGIAENFFPFQIAGAKQGGYSGTRSVNVDLVLPVEFISFDARKGDESINLYWSTASELNNDFFSVERSADAIHFNEIGRIDGAGNSTVQRGYVYKDESTLIHSGNGILYYRIRQTDYDGKSSATEIKSVKLKINKRLNIFPNPSVKNLIYLTGSFPCSGLVHVQVRDVQGRQHHKESFIVENDFIYRLNFEKPLPKGIYFLSAIAECDSQMQRIIIE